LIFYPASDARVDRIYGVLRNGLPAVGRKNRTLLTFRRRRKRRNFFVNDDSDPRVYFAAERTLLAWLRTGIAVIGLGFLVARFGVFLSVIRGQMITGNHVLSTVLGTGFVILGAIMIAAATRQHWNFSRTLHHREIPRHYSTKMSVVVAALVSLLGLLMAVYLAASVVSVF